jgi:hypothetical protein
VEDLGAAKLCAEKLWAEQSWTEELVEEDLREADIGAGEAERERVCPQKWACNRGGMRTRSCLKHISP